MVGGEERADKWRRGRGRRCRPPAPLAFAFPCLFAPRARAPPNPRPPVSGSASWRGRRPLDTLPDQIASPAPNETARENEFTERPWEQGKKGRAGGNARHLPASPNRPLKKARASSPALPSHTLLLSAPPLFVSRIALRPRPDRSRLLLGLFCARIERALLLAEKQPLSLQTSKARTTRRLSDAFEKAYRAPPSRPPRLPRLP